MSSLILKTEYYKSGGIQNIGFINTETGNYEGEQINFYENGNIKYRGFKIENHYVGKLNVYDVFGRFSFYLFSFKIYDLIKDEKKTITTTLSISEVNYKKELARIRLGLKEIPQLNLKIDNNSLNSHLILKHKIPDYVW
jgi:hypothetical protein